MPVSPFQRGAGEPNNNSGTSPNSSSKPAGSSSTDKKRSKSRPTSRKRNRRQKIKAAYAKAREDAQLAGVIPTVPEGAVRNERVDPSTQGIQPMSELVAQAIRKGWAVEDEIKPKLIEEMVRIVMDDNMTAKAKVTAFNALRMADQSQWDRDNPEVTIGGKTGNDIAVSVKTNISASELLKRMVVDGAIDLKQLSGVAGPTPLIITSSPSDSGLTGKVEASSTPPANQPEASPSLGSA